MLLDEFEVHFVQMLHTATLDDVVTRTRVMIGDLERLVLDRKMPTQSRYVRVTPISQLNLGDDFEILFGLYASSEPRLETDGRRAGTGEWVLLFVKAWLIDLVSLNDLPLPPGFVPPWRTDPSS